MLVVKMTEISSNRCCVPICSSERNETKNVTYFSFPNNKYHRRIWARLISRRETDGKHWMPSLSARICSLHFLESDFRYWANYRRLLPNAIPTVFHGYPPVIRKRQADIIKNFKKNHPITRKQQSRDVEISSPEEQATRDNPELVTEGSKLPERHSEESKPFKKRRIETDTNRNSVYELESSPRNSKQPNEPESSSAKDYEEPKRDNHLQMTKKGEHLGRGMREKTKSVKLDCPDSQVRENYTSTQSSKKLKRAYSNHSQVLENLNELKESQNIRKIRSLEQRIKWKEEQNLNLNQKVVAERNARIKAEKELEILRNSLEYDTVVVSEGLHEDSGLKMAILDDFDEDQENFKWNKKNKSRDTTPESNRAQKIKSLKQEAITKDDQRLVDLNESPQVLSEWEPKNRLTRTVKEIVEDSMKGDAKALFLLEQIEAYGKENVTHFRMSTIKKCIEWKLVNMRGYESVRNMGILTLPSSKVLRAHVDVLADTGVTATEQVLLDSDLTEVLEEIESDVDEGSMSGSVDDVYSSRNDLSIQLEETLENETHSEVDKVLNESSERLVLIIGEKRKQVVPIDVEEHRAEMVQTVNDTIQPFIGKMSHREKTQNAALTKVRATDDEGTANKAVEITDKNNLNSGMKKL